MEGNKKGEAKYMDAVYIISSASVIDGKLQCNGILVRETYEEAIITVRNSIAEDFGYSDWNDYLSNMDPEITENNGIYTIYDDNCGHEECYKIEKYTS